MYGFLVIRKDPCTGILGSTSILCGGTDQFCWVLEHRERHFTAYSLSESGKLKHKGRCM